MLAKEEGTREGREIEDLHQMRVATRRMRAAWRVFGDAYRPEKTRKMRVRLREIASDLGAVRDLDVLIEGLEHYRAELTEADQRALDPLVNEWHARRERARAVLVAALDADGYARFVEEFRAFVETDGAAVQPVGPTQPHRIRDTAPSRIWLAYEQVRAYEQVLRWADVPTLHELRIAAKWLRYTMEFVRETLGPEGGMLIERIVALQDHLGLLHDADVSAALAREFLVDRAGRLSETEEVATARYLISRERELARLRRTVGPVWRGVAGLHFRRALGRTTALL
jgi:CHAD domain-containing protein